MPTITKRAKIIRIFVRDGKPTQQVITEDRETFFLSGLAYAEDAEVGELIILDISQAKDHLTLLGTRLKGYDAQVVYTSDKKSKEAS
jgi:hypothetical protein